MKAPKKLYLRKRCKLPYDVVKDEWYEQPPLSLYGCIEYIRKNVVDERVKEAESKMREKILECAVGGLRIGRNRYTKKNVLCGIDLTHDVFQKFKDGDKLKIIVIKED